MIRLLANLVLLVIGNAIGLIIATIALPGFRMDGGGALAAILLYTAINALFSPLVVTIALKYAPALRGGIALVTTFVALLLTSLVTPGLTLSGLSTWIIAPSIIWCSSVITGILLPMVLFKKVLQNSDVPKKRSQ